MTYNQPTQNTINVVLVSFSFILDNLKYTYFYSDYWMHVLAMIVDDTAPCCSTVAFIIYKLWKWWNWKQIEKCYEANN